MHTNHDLLSSAALAFIGRFNCAESFQFLAELFVCSQLFVCKLRQCQTNLLISELTIPIYYLACLPFAEDPFAFPFPFPLAALLIPAPLPLRPLVAFFLLFECTCTRGAPSLVNPASPLPQADCLQYLYDTKCVFLNIKLCSYLFLIGSITDEE